MIINGTDTSILVRSEHASKALKGYNTFFVSAVNKKCSSNTSFST